MELFQIICVDEGEALDLKVTINLKKEEDSAGSLSINIGNFHILILHRVLRLLQLFLSPLDFPKTIGKFAKVCHWLFGNSLKTLQEEKRHIIYKFKMDGPHFLMPDTKENSGFLMLYLGKVSIENFFLGKNNVENIMVEASNGQLVRGEMTVSQTMNIGSIIISDISSKIDMKRNIENKTISSVCTFENFVCNVDSFDLQLALQVVENNILKIKKDLGKPYNLV